MILTPDMPGVAQHLINGSASLIPANDDRGQGQPWGDLFLVSSDL